MSYQENSGAGISPVEAKAVAEDTYVFGMPLVYFALQVDVLTNVSKPEGRCAPINQFVHYREFPDANFKEIVGPNVDTLYSIACLDLVEEPFVLSVPVMGDRWWLMQLLDGWNEVPAAPGTRTVGNTGGNFAIVGPFWNGALPAGLSEYRMMTNMGAIGGRTYTAGKADYEAVHKIQDQYKLIPLSKWGTDYKTPENVPVKPGVDARTPVPMQMLAMSPETYFNRLCTLLANNPAHEADAPVLARMARLGITPGAAFRMDAFTPTIRKAIEDGTAEGQKKIREGEGYMDEEVVNGWLLSRYLGRYGTRYLSRATWTFFGIGGNLIEDAFYPGTGVDGEGNQLIGEKQYELRFSQAEIPPVNAFWSLTMYADSYLVPNPLNRYARGDRDPLKYGADGSLTLYIQSESPGADREDNWLPAPKKGAFNLALRLFWPKQTVLDGMWQPPPVKRMR